MQNKPLQVGLTGGIGSGKSIVGKIFFALGIPVYLADQRARTLMLTNQDLIKEIKLEFGNEIYNPGNVLNKGLLAEKVFNNEERLNVLNAMVHPRVNEDYQDWVNKNSESPYLIKEAALLFETGSYKSLDKNISVYAPAKLRIERVIRRDPERLETEIKNIIKRQITSEESKKLADYLILNDELTMVLPQVLKLHYNFIGSSSI